MSEQTYSHLLPTVQALADAPDEARIRRIRTDRWLGYARAEAALTALEDLLSFPKRTRMPNLLLVGPSNYVASHDMWRNRRSMLFFGESTERDAPHNGEAT